jgi:hypothetical protein
VPKKVVIFSKMATLWFFKKRGGVEILKMLGVYKKWYGVL